MDCSEEVAAISGPSNRSPASLSVKADLVTSKVTIYHNGSPSEGRWRQP